MKIEQVLKLKKAIDKGLNFLSSEELSEVPQLVKVWKSGEVITLGTVRRFKGNLYESKRNHTASETNSPERGGNFWTQIKKK
jgi:hypothetical protein